jgi:dTDP-4-dehydrorhamnose reductase
VRGYSEAIFSGFTTLVLARIIGDIIERCSELSGVYHVSSELISKYELLCLLKEAYDLQVEIEPYDEVRIDRSLDSNRFRSATGFVPRKWPEMIQEMAADLTPYERWRNA